MNLINLRLTHSSLGVAHKWRHGLRGEGLLILWRQYKGHSNLLHADGVKSCQELRDVIYERSLMFTFWVKTYQICRIRSGRPVSVINESIWRRKCFRGNNVVATLWQSKSRKNVKEKLSLTKAKILKSCLKNKNTFL